LSRKGGAAGRKVRRACRSQGCRNSWPCKPAVRTTRRTSGLRFRARIFFNGTFFLVCRCRVNSGLDDGGPRCPDRSRVEIDERGSTTPASLPVIRNNGPRSTYDRRDPGRSKPAIESVPAQRVEGGAAAGGELGRVGSEVVAPPLDFLEVDAMNEAGFRPSGSASHPAPGGDEIRPRREMRVYGFQGVG